MAQADGRRRDARDNRDRILDVAAAVLRRSADATVDEIAQAAGVSRATVYRHFGSRDGLVIAVRRALAQVETHDATQRVRPAGELAGLGPAVLDVTEVLNKVPPQLLGEQIVAEAERQAGVRSVAIYLVDIDGTRLRRLSGSPEFPAEIELPLAVGPEIPRDGLALLREGLRRDLPGAVMAPMMLRGRAIGVLLALDAHVEPLLELARQAAACIALAEVHTDVFDATRRRKDINAASEIQQNLLPPRIARVSGGLLAGNVLPSYEVGGDWFDYAENPDGVWIAVADAAGRGTAAAATAAVTLGAFRARRRREAPLEETIRYMDATVRELPYPDAVSNVIVARWHGPAATFVWIGCGPGVPYLIGADRSITPLPGPTSDSLGRGRPASERDLIAHHQRLGEGEMVVMISDGVTERRHRDGGQIGLGALERTVASLDQATPPALVRALEHEIISASDDLLEDDATIVCFAPSSLD
ncbi:PP2C family protein-serine/threonine phosphatase [Conexibacter sp. DBS9H8]|uniref:PP2C family protein-serine/threonine phosphatase n=1 Tax=Conexibacter sp. DBS9H8 TaxID=2937801 RepID=UPI002010AABD|nr:SpoIIE family protein phosphatase [Conexibacter sp. DBS9H8]